MKAKRKLALVAEPLVKTPTTNAEKLQAALAFLGEKYLLHKRNAVKRLATPWGDRSRT